MQSTKYYYLALLGVVLIWGSSFVVVDVAVNYAPPLTIASWRFLFASAIFLPLTLVIRRKRPRMQVSAAPRPTDPSPSTLETPSQRVLYGALLTASLSGIAFFFPAQYISISQVGPSLPALLVCLTSPVLITLLSSLIFKESVTRIQILGFCLASIGSVLIITGGDFSVFSPSSTLFLGIFLALLTPILWSIYTIASKTALKRLDSFQFTSITTFLGTLGLFTITALSQDLAAWAAAITQPEVFWAAFYLAVGCTVFGYLIWNVAVGHLPSASVSAFLYAEPFITVFFAWAFVQELVAPLSLLGGGIVLVALAIITKYKPQVSPTPSARELEKKIESAN